MVLMGFESTGQTRVSYSWVMEARMEPWGRHLLNKNNNHAHEVHEIIFLFKMYMSFVIFQNDST
jgi:hypothetical protein